MLLVDRKALNLHLNYAKTRPTLVNIAICIVDTYPQKFLARFAIHQMLKCIDVQSIYTFSDETLIEGSTNVFTPKIQSIEEYDRIVLKELPKLVEEDFVIVFQWDGFALNADVPITDFTKYDYVGAPWPYVPTGFEVGNGGFSLRSRRLLDQLLNVEHSVAASTAFNRCEDLRICRTYRRTLEGLGINFAPYEVAKLFSFEEIPQKGTLGFHGVFNFPLIFPESFLLEHANEIRERTRAGHLMDRLVKYAEHVGYSEFLMTTKVQV